MGNWRIGKKSKEKCESSKFKCELDLPFFAFSEEFGTRENSDNDKAWKEFNNPLRDSEVEELSFVSDQKNKKSQSKTQPLGHNFDL